MSTADGFQYFLSGGLKQGLPSAAVVTPSDRNARRDKIYDVIVIGAGYAGLVACRELASRGICCFPLRGRLLIRNTPRSPCPLDRGARSNWRSDLQCGIRWPAVGHWWNLDALVYATCVQ